MGRRRSKSEAKDDLRSTQRQAMMDAVREFNRMIPTLNGFARSLTGNSKIRVKAGPVTETDGRTIFIRPPLALAVKVDHERDLCGERNEDKRLLCHRCARDEDIWHKLHHEMAHIIGNSMEAVTSRGVSSLMELVDEYHPEGVCGHASDFLFQFNKSVNYLEATAKFSGFLHFILQSLEDSRIDANMIQIKPGLRTQFYAAMHEAFTYGVETELGEEPMIWREAPIHAQVIIGLSVIAGGYKVQPGWFKPEVIAALSDPRVRAIASGAGLWPDIKESVSRSVQVFRVLASMGLFPVDKCVPKEELSEPGDEPEDKDVDSDGSSDEDQDTVPEPAGDEGGDDDSAGDAGDDADPASGDDGSGNDEGSPSPGGEGGDEQSSDPQPDPTGDGSAGDTAESGTFGDDFESDARADGSSKEGGSSDDQSDDSSLPSDGNHHDGGERGDAGERDDEHDVDAGNDGGPDETDSDGTPTVERPAEASPDPDEEDREGSGGSSTEDEPADTDGDLDAEESGRDDDGQPAAQGEGDIGSGAGGSGDGDEPEVGGEAEESAPEAEAEGFDTEEDDSLGSDSLDEDDDEGDAPVGEDIWEQANEAGTPFKGMTPEDLGGEDDVQAVLEKASPHEHVDAVEFDPDAVDADELTDEEIMVILNMALTDAVGQAAAFDTASREVAGVNEYEFPTSLFGWVSSWENRPSDFTPTEKVMGPALLKARAVFAENARSKREGNLRSGRVDGRKLGRRAALDDDRVFYKKTVPGKRDYIVGITVDCSGSTMSYGRMERIKRAVFAKAEILNRLGVKFYITGHTGGREDYWTTRGGYLQAQVNDPDSLESLMLLWVKKPDEPWNDSTRKRLANLAPLANNFDGHTLEFHRKLLEQRRESDKVLIYYTDGDMPAANYDEELEILRREIPKCKSQGISLLAVGINTESPADYGFDTVRVDSDADIIKVVRQLERRLTAGR